MNFIGDAPCARLAFFEQKNHPSFSVLARPLRTANYGFENHARLLSFSSGTLHCMLNSTASGTIPLVKGSNMLHVAVAKCDCSWP